MALLKNTVITGDLSITGNIYNVNKHYIGSNATYGSTNQPIYWNDGVPTVVTSISDSYIASAATWNAKQNALPSQSGNSGKFLTTNGSALSWGTVDALPSQSGNSGKYLTTNGTTASWTSVTFPVTSVNTKTGAVTLTASDVGARADNWLPSLSDLGLSSALRFIGTTTSTITNGGTETITVSGYTGTIKTIGNVVLNTTSGIEYLWANDAWQQLGDATSFAVAGHVHGKITNSGAIASTDNVAIAINDRLIISDASDSYLLKNSSIIFDGSTTTKALTPKGTWETFSTTDENVKQTVVSSSDNAVYPILLSSASGNTTTTAGAYKSMLFRFANSTGGLIIYNSDYTKELRLDHASIKLSSTAHAYFGCIYLSTNLTANQTYYLPNKSGTIALTSDLPSVVTNSYSVDSTNTGYIMLNTSTSASSTLTATKTNKGLQVLDEDGHNYMTIQVGVSSAEEGMKGKIKLSNAAIDRNYTSLIPSADSAITLTLPDETGTLALTSQATKISIIDYSEVN